MSLKNLIIFLHLKYFSGHISLRIMLGNHYGEADVKYSDFFLLLQIHLISNLLLFLEIIFEILYS